MFSKNVKASKGPRCAQCGKPSIGSTTRTFADTPVTTEWCETHFPSIWQLVERDRNRTEKRHRAEEAAKWTRVA